MQTCLPALFCFQADRPGVPLAFATGRPHKAMPCREGDGLPGGAARNGAAGSGKMAGYGLM